MRRICGFAAEMEAGGQNKSESAIEKGIYLHCEENESKPTMLLCFAHSSDMHQWEAMERARRADNLSLRFYAGILCSPNIVSIIWLTPQRQKQVRRIQSADSTDVWDGKTF